MLCILKKITIFVIMGTPDEYKGLGDISNLTFGDQEHAVDIYVNSLLFGELKEYLEDEGVKIFKGISRDITRKYMKKFNDVLKLNDYTGGALDVAITVDYKGETAIEYYGFFVFHNDRGNVFGSFPAAYKFANEIYLSKNMILGNGSIQLAENAEVKFGRVLIQDGNMVETDIEMVVNKDFYKSFNND